MKDRAAGRDEDIKIAAKVGNSEYCVRYIGLLMAPTKKNAG